METGHADNIASYSTKIVFWCLVVNIDVYFRPRVED